MNKANTVPYKVIIDLLNNDDQYINENALLFLSSMISNAR